MRTKEEIQDQLERLNAVKPKVPATTFFGDSNVAAIEAQIMVLENSYTEDDAYDVFGTDDEGDPIDESHELTNALDASRWLYEEDDDVDPARDWEEVAGGFGYKVPENEDLPF